MKLDNIEKDTVEGSALGVGKIKMPLKGVWLEQKFLFIDICLALITLLGT